jgi:hypothetical protein
MAFTIMLQARRDYFGAHACQRVDKEGSLHTERTFGITQRFPFKAIKKYMLHKIENKVK